MAKKTTAGMRPDELNYDKSFGGNLSFAAAEAYRLLRTNLDFSIPSGGKCKIIGVTSTLRGEGKSTTSVNIAYTFAETGQHVLLLEADLRLPNAAKRLKLKECPGMSNLLIGQCTANEALQHCDLSETLRVITAGDIPPNPAELLNSEQMAEALRAFSRYFDVIIVDLPPVSVVSDALIMSRMLSGMVVVVRESVCGRKELNDTIRQLEFTECKILGFVMTGAGSQSKKYGSYKKSSGYGYASSRKSRNSEEKR